MSLGLTSKPQARLRPDRQTVKQLLAAAHQDTDAASVFYNGTSEADTTEAIIVIKGRDEMRFVVDMLLRQKMLTRNKPVEGAAP